MKKLSLVLLLFILTTTSCYYLDTDVYEVDITSDYNPSTRITSNFSNIDSVRSGDSIYFRYEIEIDTGKFYYADMYLDNSQIARFDTISDSLWIPAYFFLEERQYDLTMVAFFKSYSGTLADMINAELIFADTTWTFNVYSEKLQ